MLPEFVLGWRLEENEKRLEAKELAKMIPALIAPNAGVNNAAITSSTHSTIGSSGNVKTEEKTSFAIEEPHLNCSEDTLYRFETSLYVEALVKNKQLVLGKAVLVLYSHAGIYNAFLFVSIFEFTIYYVCFKVY